jgi:predicted peptidase
MLTTRLMRFAVCAVVLAASVAHDALAQGRRGADARTAAALGRGRGDDARIETRSYFMIEAQKTMTYDVFVSKKVASGEPAPLIIFLHGLGTPARRLLPGLLDEAEKRGYVIAAPVGYNLQGWYGANGQTSPTSTPANLGELSEKDVMNVLDQMRTTLSIDERRIYLLGQSMGGAGALYLGPKYSRTWAALGASAPALRRHQSSSVLETIPTMPVILIHGDADRAVPVVQSREWAAKMKLLGMPHEYHEIRGGTHSEGIARGAKWIFDFFDKHPKQPVS